ncbi:MAG: ATP-dependent metallopeptidase FtsH/Yme1/Tma family protein, partial [Lachnospiraceae bacterium]|nr:ATP-dependent metallopeptidase FtsH/Yme1/Tma family protein [Candidatus Hippenecus merdae]
MDQKKNEKYKGLLKVAIAVLIAIVIVNLARTALTEKSREEVSYDTFYKMVADGDVEKVVVGPNEIEIYVNSGSKDYTPLIRYYTRVMEDQDRTAYLLRYNVKSYQAATDNSGFIWDILLTVVLPFGFAILLFSILSRRMGGGGGIMG